MTSSNKEQEDSKDKLAVLAFMIEVGLPTPHPHPGGSPVLQKEPLSRSSSQRTHIMLLSLLFQAGDKENKGFQPLLEALPRISKPRESGWGRGWLLSMMRGVKALGQLL